MPMPMRTSAASTSQTQPGIPTPVLAAAADKSPVLGTSGVLSTTVVLVLVEALFACGEFVAPVLPVSGVPGVAVFGDAVGTSAVPPELWLIVGSVVCVWPAPVVSMVGEVGAGVTGGGIA